MSRERLKNGTSTIVIREILKVREFESHSSQFGLRYHDLTHCD